MIKVDLNALTLNELVAKEAPKQHCKVTFPLLGAHGTNKLATVYFELEPGDNVGRHTDSAEELLLVIEGNVEASIGTETSNLSTGQMAVVPTSVAHDVKNTGNSKAKILGFFGGANHITTTFDNGWEPNDMKEVNTAVLFAQTPE